MPKKSTKSNPNTTQTINNKAKPRKEKKIKDPNAPKKPLSPYLLYTQERRSNLLKERPTLGHKEVISVMAEEWRKMNESEKAVYNKKIDVDKERYRKQKEDYEKKK